MIREISGVDGVDGVELLALYGEDDERLGRFRFLPGLKKFARKAVRFTPQYWAAKGAKAAWKKRKKLIHLTPQYWAAKGVKKIFSGEPGAVEEIIGAYEAGRLSGDEVEYLGAFLPGLTKALKKVGKFTSGITTAAARFVGVPKSALDALAKIDPSKRGSMINKAIAAVKGMPSAPAQTGAIVPASAMKSDTKKMLIVGGAAAFGLLAIGILAGAGRRRA